ncbi:MAG: winged helix-turn-helix domain-containing protein [Betaproteobacteria bacterium]|nr:winged helix-turn-helix domain-containing protein [Betaproteobacteria bacterium]
MAATILVVEDEPAIQELISYSLEQAGYRALRAASAEEALEMVRAALPDRVYTRAQLLDHVWGDHVFVEERTIDVHIRRLRKALEQTGHHRLIQTVRSAGYRLSVQG